MKGIVLGFGFLIAFSVWLAETWTNDSIHQQRTKSEFPRRIVSLNLGSDEILLSLAPDRLVGVTRYAVDPDSSNVVSEAEKIPYKLSIDPEVILKLHPDLVILGGHTSLDVVEQLEKAGIRTYRIQGYNSIREIEETILELGDLVGEPKRAAKIVEAMRSRLRSIAERTEKSRPVRVLSYSPSGFSAGQGTIFDDVVFYAGGRNLSAETGLQGFRKLPLEQLLLLDPEVIIVSDWLPGYGRFY